MSKKEESEFLALVDDFNEKVQKFFPKDGKHSKGIFLVAIDGDISENATGVRGMVLGKKSELIPGIVKIMNDSEPVYDIVKESSLFYDFTRDPKKVLMSAIKKILEED
jgi:hypothetical protein